jgi:hypothetical protein
MPSLFSYFYPHNHAIENVSVKKSALFFNFQTGL